MRFLNETNGLSEIRSLLANTDEATLVVAFWGRGAIDALGLDKHWKSLRIVCNLDSGACNPAEVRRLRLLKGDIDVRTDWRLHGKVYLTQEGVVMGSSNASSNGLAVEGAALKAWAEANIYSTDVAFLEEVNIWCRERIENSLTVTDEALALAQDAWDLRIRSTPPLGGLTTDFLEAVRRQPGHPALANVKVIRWATAISTEAVAFQSEAIEADHSLKGTEIYEGWGTKIAPDDWLVDFDVSRTSPKFTGFWHVVHVDGDNDVVFARRHDFLAIPTLGRLTIRKGDRAALGKRVRDMPGPLPHVVEAIFPISDLVD
ncbi:hypothetical protein ELG88_18070 [Rhizobium leguminosarum]|uniref:phospholipase D family protein n=1 Tax=Rhizobium leguminosarum TaxID=384 RepID=UPI0010326B99|nr:phospholipase D family protein [Rhizobium leguminosarum]TBF36990.1 hypothetical protein ELG88_18070 [Rhizobium leguminosarum]